MQNRLLDYAKGQGFVNPVEKLGTAIHEMVHINSASHEGYFIDGVYYEPYLRRDAWPSLVNRDIAGYMSGSERGPIYTFYVLNTPTNHLGNVVDELNAYQHVLQFICANEPESTQRQVQNLIGHLHLQEAYLRTLRTVFPGEYARLARNRESRGALITITERVWRSLAACGLPKDRIPSTEAYYFRELVQKLGTGSE